MMLERKVLVEGKRHGIGDEYVKRVGIVLD